MRSFKIFAAASFLLVGVGVYWGTDCNWRMSLVALAGWTLVLLLSLLAQILLGENE